VHDAHATRLTLSHFCPTAASMLFCGDRLRIVDAPADLVSATDREGLDATRALPPLLHPGMLMDPASYAAWEARAVEAIEEASSPEHALARVAASVECLRPWTPAGPALVEAVRAAWEDGNGRAGAGIAAMRRFTPEWLARTAFASVSGGLDVDASPLDADADMRFVAPAWPAFAAPVQRYLAGRLFGSWVAYQGRGLRSVVASAACALAVLRISAARACAAASRALDAPLLTGAFRQADLLLVHKADRQVLADGLSEVEDRS
jgi:hypothetical protein